MKNLFFALAVLFFTSCSTESNNVDSEVLSKELTTQNMRGTNDLDNQTKEKLNISNFENIESQSTEAINFINELKKQSISTVNLDLDKINYMTFTNSSVKIISIPISGTSEKLLAYNFNDKYVVLKSIENGNQLNISTIDNNSFIEASNNNSLVIEKTFDNNAINDFSNMVYSSENKSSDSNLSSREEYCRSMSYTKCARCTVENIYGNGFIFVVASAFLPELSVAVLASCIGSGPNSWF